MKEVFVLGEWGLEGGGAGGVLNELRERNTLSDLTLPSWSVSLS